MTITSGIKKNKTTGQLRALITSLLFTALIFSTTLFLSDDISEFVTKGLMLSVKIIIPSIFPFLIITDIIIRYIQFEKVDVLCRLFQRIFRINGAALSVFVCGILSGFPMGAKLSLSLYENGKISKKECERLMGFSSNASPGYIICAIGGGMLGNLKVGMLLYFITVLSAVITGALLGIKETYTQNTDFVLGQNYSFSETIKSAALVCLNICAFITFFSLVCGMVEKYVGYGLIALLLLPFLEIGAATSYISDLYIYYPLLSFALISFTVSFSGFCVYAQIQSLITDKNISMGKYTIAKLLQGAVAMLLAAVSYQLFL